MKNKITDISFDIMLVLKGINSIIEILGGILLIFITPERLSKIVYLLTAKEIVEDPKDIFIRTIVNINNNFSIPLQHFFIFYLLSHGIIKIIMVTLLYKKKLWAYPLSIIILITFIIYQMYKIYIAFSITIILLTLLDLVLVILTIIEYKSMLKK